MALRSIVKAPPAAAVILGLLGVLGGAARAQAVFFDWSGDTVDARVGESTCCPGDLNGDGFPDVLYTQRSTGAASDQIVTRSGRDGAVLAVETLPFGVARLTAMGDVNGDGDGVGDYAYNIAVASIPFAVPQIAIVMRSGAGGAVIWSYAAPIVGVDGYSPWILGGAFDYDGDGVRDVVIQGTLGIGLLATTVLRIRSGATGNLSASYVPPASHYYSYFPTQDITGDGVPDVVVTLPAASYVAVLRGPDLALHALIAPPSAAVGLLFGIYAGAAGDSDGDGVADLTVAIKSDVGAGSAVGAWSHRVYTGANFTYAYSVLSANPGAGGAAFPIEDVDGDGKFDFVMHGQGSAPGGAGFSMISAATGSVLYSESDAAADSSWVRGGDFDGDGVRELLNAQPTAKAAATGSGRLRVLSHSPSPAGVTVLPGGCGVGAAGGGVLIATAPILGQGASFYLTGAAPLTGGNLAFDIGFPSAFPLGGTCVFHLDLAHIADWVFFPISTDATGAAAAFLPLPFLPFIAGLPVTSQVALFPTSSSLGFDMSNGLLLTLGY